MPFVQRTRNMVAGNGYTISIGDVAVASIIARGECWIRPEARETAPPAPTSNPAPAVGQEATWFHMLPNEVLTLGMDLIDANRPGDLDRFGYLLVWAVGSGTLVVNAH